MAQEGGTEVTAWESAAHYQSARDIFHREFKMKIWIRLALLALAVHLVSSTTVPAIASEVIALYTIAPTPLLHAAHRLSDYTGIAMGRASGQQGSISIELNSSENPRIGAQGYSIQTSKEGDIVVRGNTSGGTANGVYTLLRTLMIEHRKDPFSRKWDVEEKPQFSIRAMQVAPYRFGGSFGYAALSPDRWSLEEWIRYVDFMRLCNMTTLCIVSARMYHPDNPHSWREKWRFEVWKQVMDYCHQVGMKFDWMMAPNMVTEQCFWDNPDLQTKANNAWWGSALAWHKAKDLILRDNAFMLKYFRGLDALELIYTDGGAHRDEPDPEFYIADSTRSYMKLMREAGNDGGFVYWNWYLDYESEVNTPPALAKANPKFLTAQEDVIPLLPKNVAWLDASMLTLIQHFGANIRLRGNPPLREGLLVGKENGFHPIIEFFWYMNPEFSINIFPHPYIQRAIQEAHYARDEIGADGAMGYRLAPPCRFIDDYIYFRLTSDPSLTQEQLVDEVAGLLAERPEDQQQVKVAINSLEQFWTNYRLEDLEKAEQILRETLATEKSKNLEYVSNGVTFLTYIVRMAQPGVTEAQRTKLKWELYRTVKPMYIFQGITADIVWQPEALRFFNTKVDWMIQEYRSPFVSKAFNKGTVDRSVYPKATSEPFALKWPKQTGEPKN